MTKLKAADVLDILKLIRANFDNAYNFKTEEEARLLIEFWYDSLKEYPKEVVYQAVGNAIKHSEFAPKIATVIKEINALLSSQQESDSELWDEFSEALSIARRELPYSLCIYDTVVDEQTGKTTADAAREVIQQTYEGLSPKIKEYCGSLRGFKEIAACSSNENFVFEKARFMKQLPLIEERVRTKQQISPQLANLIKGIADGNRKLIGDKE